MPEPRSLTALPNLGPVMVDLLAEIGIRDAVTLRAVGAVKAFRRLRFRDMDGRAVSLNALYAMEGALTGRDWRGFSLDEKHVLLAKAGVAREADAA